MHKQKLYVSRERGVYNFFQNKKLSELKTESFLKPILFGLILATALRKVLYFKAYLFHIAYEPPAVEEHRKQEGKRSYKHVHGYYHPEPRPVFFLPSEFTYRYGFKEARGEKSQKAADGVIITRSPDKRGVFVVDIKEIRAVTQRYKSKLGLENLIEHYEKHNVQKHRRRCEYTAVGNPVMTEKRMQKRYCHQHPVVIVKSYNVKRFTELICLCHRLLGVEYCYNSAKHADIKHIVVKLLAF